MAFTFKGGVHVDEAKNTASCEIRIMPAPARVSIPLSQHIGAHCTPCVKVGDTVEAKIIAIDKERLSLSMKQLVEDPWISEVEGLKKGSKVEGTVTRITPFGAFVQISPAVEALVHVSELGEGSDVDPEKVFTLNERKDFKVLDIDKEGRKISLSISK